MRQNISGGGGELSAKTTTTGLRHTKKEGERVSPFPSKSAEIVAKILLEIPLQQALERLAVAGLVARHLMDGIVDSI